MNHNDHKNFVSDYHEWASSRRGLSIAARILIIMIASLLLLSLRASATRADDPPVKPVIYLPIIAHPSTAPPPGPGWSPQEEQAIKQIVLNAGKVEPLAPTGDVVTPGPEERDNTYKYTTEIHHEVSNKQDLTFLGVNDNTIWPGNLLRGDTLHDFLYTPIMLERAPVTLSVNLESVSCAGDLSVVVNDPRLSTVRNGIRQLLQQARYDCPTIPARAAFDFKQVYSESHMNLYVGSSVDWGSGDVEASFDWDSTTEHTKMLGLYRQLYYTVDVDPPMTQADFFDPELLTVSEISAAMPAGARPVYVSGVTYGMMAIMLIESSYSADTMNFAMDAAYKGGLAEVDVETQLTVEDIMENSTINILVYGGSTAGLKGIEKGLEGFLDVIHASMDAGPDSPGVPLIYRFNHFSDHTLAGVTLMSDYTIKGPPIPLYPKVRVTLDKLVCTRSDDEGSNNDVDITQVFLQSKAYYGLDDASLFDGPAYVYAYNGGEVTTPKGYEWIPQGIHSRDITFENLYPYGHNFEDARLILNAEMKDNDDWTNDEFGDGSMNLIGAGQILGTELAKTCPPKNLDGTDMKSTHCFEIINDADFTFRAELTIELVDP